MAETPEILFSQVQSVGALSLSLRRDRVVIAVKSGKEVREVHVQLSEISPTIEIVSERRFGPWLFLVMLAGMSGCAGWRVSGPSHLSDILEGTCYFLVFFFLACSYVAIQPTSVARVRNKHGELLFEMYRSRDVALPFEEFLLNLQRRLQALNA